MEMNEYKWMSKDGIETKISFSTNFDNLINRYKGKFHLGSIVLMDGAIVFYMPKVMRYCFEEQVDLRKNKFIRDLPPTPQFSSEEHYAREARFHFKMPLKKDSGTISKCSGELAIHSYPSKFLHSSVFFKAEEVPKLVEGFLRVYDSEVLGYARISQAVNLYHEDLDRGIIR